MDSCNECGNLSVTPKFFEGHSVFECDLCGAVTGSTTVVATIEDARDAEAVGIDGPVFAVQRAIARLDGLRVTESFGGDKARRRLPFVRFAVLDARGYVQLENLAKSLRLSSASTSMAWTVEVDYQTTLEFVLTPRVPTTRPREADIALSQSDLVSLGRAFDRDVRLSWWRHPTRGPLA